MEVSNLQELGEYLKSHREAKGLSREALSQQTKIPMKTMNAIEEGLSDALPQQIFTRGFVRSYAQALNLDMYEVNAMLDEVFPHDAMPNNIQPLQAVDGRSGNAPTKNSKPVDKRLLIIIAIILLLLGLGGYVYAFHKDDVASLWHSAISSISSVTSSSSNTQSASSSSSERLNTSLGTNSSSTNNTSANSSTDTTQASEQSRTASVSPEQTDEHEEAINTNAHSTAHLEDNTANATDSGSDDTSGNVSGSGLVAAITEAATTGSAENEENEEDEAGASVSPQAPAPTPVAETPTATQTQAPGMQKVVVTVTDRCWMRAEYDGKKRDGTFKPGQAFTIEFKNKLRLQIGKPAVAKVTYNGKAYPFTYANKNSSKFLYFNAPSR